MMRYRYMTEAQLNELVRGPRWYILLASAVAGFVAGMIVDWIIETLLR